MSSEVIVFKVKYIRLSSTYRDLLNKVFDITDKELPSYTPSKYAKFDSVSGQKFSIVCSPEQFAMFIVERNKIASRGRSSIQNLVTELDPQYFHPASYPLRTSIVIETFRRDKYVREDDETDRKQWAEQVLNVV